MRSLAARCRRWCAREIRRTVYAVYTLHGAVSFISSLSISCHQPDYTRHCSLGVRKPASSLHLSRSLHSLLQHQTLSLADDRPFTSAISQRVPAVCSAHTDNLTVTGVLLSVDQSRGTVYLWHCDQVTSRRRLSEDI